MIRENVKRIREYRGVTKTHIANNLGMTLNGYSQIEKGEVRLDSERLKVIAQLLCVSPAVFFDDELTESVIYEQKQIS